jgi:hypothetical protein
MTMKPTYCKSNSISYREAGERQRLSLERLVEGGAGLQAFRVAAAVWTLTAGYSKAWDLVYIDALADITGMDRRATRRGLSDAQKLGALQWRPTKWRHSPSLVGLPDGNSEGVESTPSSDPVRGSNQPPHLEPRTQDSSTESTESDEWNAESGTHRSSLIASDQENGVNADELARWRESNRTKPQPRDKPVCTECGGPLGYEIGDDETTEGLLCLACFNGWSK